MKAKQHKHKLYKNNEAGIGGKKNKKKQEQIKNIFRLTSFKSENYNNIDLYFF